MINARIQIETGKILDTYAEWGFIYKSSDTRFSPPEKSRDVTSYAEYNGENVDPRTVYDAFDYTAEFVIEAENKNLENANSKIKAFNDAIREKIPDSDMKRCKIITLYDDYKRCKIVGIPEVIQTVRSEDFFRRADNSQMDCVVVKLKIRVSDPTLCDFNTNL